MDGQQNQHKTLLIVNIKINILTLALTWTFIADAPVGQGRTAAFSGLGPKRCAFRARDEPLRFPGRSAAFSGRGPKRCVFRARAEALRFPGRTAAFSGLGPKRCAFRARDEPLRFPGRSAAFSGRGPKRCVFRFPQGGLGAGRNFFKRVWRLKQRVRLYIV